MTAARFCRKSQMLVSPTSLEVAKIYFLCYGTSERASNTRVSHRTVRLHFSFYLCGEQRKAIKKEKERTPPTVKTYVGHFLVPRQTCDPRVEWRGALVRLRGLEFIRASQMRKIPNEHFAIGGACQRIRRRRRRKKEKKKNGKKSWPSGQRRIQERKESTIPDASRLG